MSEYLQLCHKYKPMDDYTGWLVSEKLDGQRAWWDGGITRGRLKKDVPWANCLKDKRYITEQRATGLWSRLGNVIHAPDWWLNTLPIGCMLDGELWSGYEHRQHLMTAIKGNDPTFRVHGNRVRYMIYDCPPPAAVLMQRTCNVGAGRKLTVPFCVSLPSGLSVATTLLRRLQHANYAIEQMEGPSVAEVLVQQVYDSATIESMLDAVLVAGGEGLVLSNPNSKYVTERSHNRLKMKPFEDADGVAIGWTAGAATDKGSRLLGKMGSLRLSLENGRSLDLSGFTDEERAVPDYEWAVANPGVTTSSYPLKHFKLGQKISFKYRGLTADGLPMEARYWRVRSDE